jgi:hypothetical protein
MPRVMNIRDADLIILYTNIGRGHPTYLDGIVEILTANYPALSFFQSDVFALSRGFSLRSWQLARTLYRIGGKGGAVSSMYGRLRRSTGGGEGGFLHRLLGRDVVRALESVTGPVLVAHPILARLLAGRNRVIYQHGELAAPNESLVTQCEKIFVPLDSTAAVFRSAGAESSHLAVIGQCIEPALVSLAGPAFDKRITRLSSDKPLTAALFSSGAYPTNHVSLLRRAARSLYRAGHSVIFFAGQSAAVADAFDLWLNRQRIESVRTLDGNSRVKIIVTSSRQEENRLVAGVFDRLDIFLAPAHERTNWAVGLGLPQFILTPHIGSYAPLNAALALERDVAVEITDDRMAVSIGEFVESLRRDGKLASMACNGFGRTSIAGFAAAATILAEMTIQE